MVGTNAAISNNVLMLLKQNGKKQNELADALGVSKQVMSNMLSGSRMINAVELRQMAEFFHVPMERLMEAPAGRMNTNAIHAFMGEVKTTSARKSLEIADEMANLVLFYARVRDNAEEMENAWEA
jgi:transcriptional regulator with XRE-family HTH domain